MSGLIFDFSQWSCQLSWISYKNVHINVMFVLKLFSCVLEKWKMQITNLNDYVKLYNKKKIVEHDLNEVPIYFWVGMGTLCFLSRLLLWKVWKSRGNLTVHLSPVTTGLSRSRLQSGNYLFSQSSRAGDLPMVIPSLSFVYCLDRHVQIFLSIVCYSTRVVLCLDTTGG